MSVIRLELVNAAYEKAFSLTDYNDNIHDTLDKRHEFRMQTILADESLTNDEKSEAIIRISKNYDLDKVLFNKGKKRNCENCQLECLAISYCEHCIRNYLKAKFSNWTSGNDNIDNLIQKCQIEALMPNKIVEWIPYNNSGTLLDSF